MLRRLVTCAALAAALLLSLAGAAQARDPVIGIGEQKPGFFTNEHFTALGVRDVRVIAAWDALSYRWQRAELDAYMAAAEEAGARVLLGFGHSRAEGRTRTLPTPKRFRREFRRFRARYPLVRDYLTWNEANHCGQPTCRRPERAAQYFDVIAADCRGCRIVAADVLDTSRARAVAAAVRARRAPQAADLGPAQLHRRQPLLHARHARAAARPPAARCGSRRPAGWSSGATNSRSSSRAPSPTRRRRCATSSGSRA